MSRVRGLLEAAKGALDRNPGDPSIALEYIKYLPEVEEAGLSDLVWSLCSGNWGCHRNDVIGVFEHLEEWLDANQEAVGGEAD